ncbi:hypothetical protein V8G54_002779 [Vigna mungo]|uniref:Uncharacterized protein n=1 Tax=Vigna mungo TaxID=3915 RepID=A0AAQ3PAV1_VIGMU
MEIVISLIILFCGYSGFGGYPCLHREESLQREEGATLAKRRGCNSPIDCVVCLESFKKHNIKHKQQNPMSPPSFMLDRTTMKTSSTRDLRVKIKERCFPLPAEPQQYQEKERRIVLYKLKSISLECGEDLSESAVVAGKRGWSSMNQTWCSLRGSVFCSGDSPRSRGGSRSGPRSNPQSVVMATKVRHRFLFFVLICDVRRKHPYPPPLLFLIGFLRGFSTGSWWQSVLDGDGFIWTQRWISGLGW